jgi:Replication protein C C-terminal region
MVHGIAPDELVRFAPKLKPYLRSPRPTWSDIVDAADWLRHDLGVSRSLWGEACVTLGRDLAAVALAIVSTKEPEPFPEHARRLFPRHGRQSQRRRIAPPPHRLGLAAPPRRRNIATDAEMANRSSSAVHDLTNWRTAWKSDPALW